MLSSGSQGPAKEEGTGTASRQRKGSGPLPGPPLSHPEPEGAPDATPWVSPLGSWSRESEGADNNSSQSVASPLQAEQLNDQTSSLLEYPVYLQNQLSAKVTTEARFESAQPSSAIPHMDPTSSLQPSE